MQADPPFSLVTHMNNFLHSIIPNVDVYNNNQQKYNSDGLYALKCYIPNNLKGVVSEYKAISLCEV